VLIATGAVSPAEFVPIAAITMYAGSFVGYTWARRLGAPAMERIAARLHASATYTRAVARLQHTGALPFIVARLIPAVRTQTTLAAGAAAIDRRMFLVSNAIAVTIWLGVLTTAGWLIGVPAEHFLGQAFTFLLSGAVLLVLAFAAYQIGRRQARVGWTISPAMQRVPVPVRVALAVSLDLGLIVVIVSALGRIARFVELIERVNLGLPLVPDGVYDLLVTIGVAAVAYLALSRLSLRATIGERLFRVRYRRARSAKLL
jgi:membrane protein DedA with SNARE-associated domain